MRNFDTAMTAATNQQLRSLAWERNSTMYWARHLRLRGEPYGARMAAKRAHGLNRQIVKLRRDRGDFASLHRGS